MLKVQRTYQIADIEFIVIYSARRSMAISILPDASVVIRVPYLTSFKTITRLVQQKSGWIIKHRNSYREKVINKHTVLYISGELHLFRGKEYVLRIEKSVRPSIRIDENNIVAGLQNTDDPAAIKRLIYKWYKNEASVVFPEIFQTVLKTNEIQMFKPTGFVIRTMKRRWGSCSNRGIITLSTELIKLPDRFIEYVIKHELCHLRHHNHSSRYYKLLSEVCPDWKIVRKELRKYIQ
jgi:predicted metal-dependent hydrolase